MIAYWLEDFKHAHFGALGIEGIHAEFVNPNSSDALVARLMESHGYVLRDEVTLSSPDFDILHKASTEHSHEDDEVRYVVEGGGVFDIRTKDDRWLRVVVGVGDLLIIPAGRYHRFYLSASHHEHSRIRAIRLFKDASGWKPNFRV